MLMTLFRSALLLVSILLFRVESLKDKNGVERGAVNQAYIAKYDLDAEGDWVETGEIFRFDRCLRVVRPNLGLQ